VTPDGRYRIIMLPSRHLQDFDPMTATRSSAAPLTSLAELIAGLSPRLDATEYVFVQLDETATMPMASEILASFREAEGTTLIMSRDRAADLGLTPLLRCARITLGVLSDLNAVGLIAAVSERLAQAQIPVNVFSAIHHDHLFVPPQQASRALELLREMASAGTPT
jgi:hypothetical protein